MPRLSETEWMKARAFYESGANQSAVAEKFGVSRKAVQLKIASDGWTQDFEPVIRRKVAEKLASIPAQNSHGASSKKQAEATVAALDAEAERRVKVAARHVELAAQAMRLQQQAIGEQVSQTDDGKKKVRYDPDFDLQKSAKINAETVHLLITLERKLHRIEDLPQRNGASAENADPMIFLKELAQFLPN